MIHVVCAKWGNDFEGYPKRLRNMVRRNLKAPHKFHCFSGDYLRFFAPDPFWQYKSQHRPTLYRGYPLLFVFNPALPLTGKILFLGLDVVITGSLDELVEAPGFTAIRDWWQGNYNNSVMLFDAGSHADVFTDFPPDEPESKTEQDWLKEKIPNGNTWPDEWVRSYKIHCKDGVPENCRVVVCHGEPKNHQINDAWLKEHWQ